MSDRLEKAERTRRQTRWLRWRQEDPTCDLLRREADFQLGYQSGYGRAYRAMGKTDESAGARGGRDLGASHPAPFAAIARRG